MYRGYLQHVLICADLNSPDSCRENERVRNDRRHPRGWRPPCGSASACSIQRAREESRVSEHDVLYGYRLRLFALAGEISVRAACRATGVHHSTF
jgi:hypothetical protein